MMLDNLEDARIAAIEGLSELKTSDPRIYRMLVDAMEHEDPAIRLASLNTLRKLTGKDQGTEAAAWRRYLKPIIEAGASPASAKDSPAAAGPADVAGPERPGAAPSGSSVTIRPR
jgi:hypothetical protein